jgi:predicted nucleic acid-binding protein
MGLDWHLPTGAEMRRAIEIARTYDIAVYDAVFIALAESLGAILVTADERLAQRLNDLAYVRFLGNMELLAN